MVGAAPCRHLLHLRKDLGRSGSTVNVCIAALRFLYRVTLKRPAFTLMSAGGSVPPLKKKLEWREMVEIAYEDAAEEYARKHARE